MHEELCSEHVPAYEICFVIEVIHEEFCLLGCYAMWLL
jgi:hypothetical protein